MDITLQHGPFNPSLYAKSKELVEELSSALHVEELDARQKSKIQWLEARDANTSLFHANIRKRKLKLNIKSLSDLGGRFLLNRDEIAQASIKFFQVLWTDEASSVYLKPSQMKKLSNKAQDWLDKLVSEEEIKKVIFEVDLNKSPGLDNFTAKFYQSSWATIKDDLIKAILDFFQKNKLLREVNSTFIVLNPKSLDAATLDHFKPISLCNFLYKIITKSMANRIKKVIPELVNHTQAAFITDHNIIDNIRLA